MNNDMGALARHLDALRLENLRPTTVERRGLAVKRLERWVAPTPLLEVSTDEIRSWLGRELKASSRAVELSNVRCFYRWAVEEEVIERDPTLRLRRPKVPRYLPRPVSEPDIELALEHADPRVRPWLLLAGWAGLRCFEIAALRAEDLWWEDRLILLPDVKGGGDDRVRMCRWLGEELGRCDLPKTGHLFRRRDGRTGPVRAWTVSQEGNKELRRIGVPATMHQFRHRFGTQAHRATHDLRVTQELLRHKSPNTTQVYTWIDDKDLASAVELLPTITRLPQRESATTMEDERDVA